MTVDLGCLVANALWGLLLVFVEVGGKTRVAGPKWNAGNRDGAPEFPAWVARAGRALGNHKENFPVFATAVVVLALTKRSDGATATAAIVYVVARVLHALVYLAGITGLRSLVFVVGLGATLFLYAKILF